jgi:uncharacterized membrane protein YfcA
MITMTIFLLTASFAAGFLDSIAGGGGLLLLPALLFSGLPPQIALGTNKFIAVFGLSGSAINFIRNKKIVWSVVRRGILFSLVGVLLGSNCILLLSNEIVGKIILVLIPVAMLATVFSRKKQRAEDDAPPAMLQIKIPVICFVIGFYDGFFGPGSGSFLVLALYLFAGLDLVRASATTKAVTVVTCFISAVVFIMHDKVMLSLGLLLAVANIAGNCVGSQLIIRKGTKVVKNCLVVSLIVLFVSLSAKYLSS